MSLCVFVVFAVAIKDATAREDAVEASISFPGETPNAIRVFGLDGNKVPAQLNGMEKGAAKVVFLAKMPPVGYVVYSVQAAHAPAASTLKATQSSLENARYSIKLDQNGDVTSILDKAINRELLSAPLRLAILTDNPRNWPAWNMDFDQVQAAPRTVVGEPATFLVLRRSVRHLDTG